MEGKDSRGKCRRGEERKKRGKKGVLLRTSREEERGIKGKRKGKGRGGEEKGSVPTMMPQPLTPSAAYASHRLIFAHRQ